MNQLIFIYKVNSGIMSNLPGAVAKAFGGKSVCSLCNITYGPVKQKPSWERFLFTLPQQPEVYHADETPKQIREFLQTNRIELPVVLKRADGMLSVAVSADELASCDGKAECLIDKLKDVKQAMSCANGVCRIE